MISVQYFSLVVGTAHYLKQSIKSAPFVGHSVGPQTSWRRERVVTRGGQLKILRPTFNHCLMVVQFTWGGRMGVRSMYIVWLRKRGGIPFFITLAEGLTDFLTNKFTFFGWISVIKEYIMEYLMI